MTLRRQFKKILQSFFMLFVLLCFASFCILLNINQLVYAADDESQVIDSNETSGETDIPLGEDTNLRGDQVWVTDTTIDVFSTEYYNKNGKQVVCSENGDKVIAPGTNGSYQFSLTNPTDYPVDYTVELTVWFEKDDEILPVRVKLLDPDDIDLTENDEEWETVTNTQILTDKRSLDAGQKATYTLKWRGLFDYDDEYDTLLGDEAVDEDMNFWVQIRTIVEQDLDGDTSTPVSNFIRSIVNKNPFTGISRSSVVYLIAGGLVLVLILLVLFFRRKADENGSN